MKHSNKHKVCLKQLSREMILQIAFSKVAWANEEVIVVSELLLFQ